MTNASLNGEDQQSPTSEDSLQFARLCVVDSTEVSQQTLEIARKNEAIILRNCRTETASAVARNLGMSDSSLSRWINTGPMALASLVLARLGLKVVPADAVVFIKPEEFN